MASRPEADFFRDGQSCLPCLHDRDGDQSKEAPSFERRNRQLNDQSEMKETEDLIASEFRKLSVQERSKALDDIHCVADELEETPEMIEQSLTEFDQIVQTTATRMYSIALNQNRSYVEDRSFRLKFLRANTFNVRKSVHQMMSFLHQKALYFGEEKVAHDIVLGDMNGEEIELMRSTFFQILKDRDRSGRVVLYHASFNILGKYKFESLLHVMYHVIFNIAIPIPSVQAKGVVMIYYDESKGASNFEFPGLSHVAKAHRFMDALPFRVSSLQMSLHSSPSSLSLYNKVAQAGLNALSARELTRTRLHYGSDMERQYQLRTYGIPLENFPVDKNGNVRSEITTNWCDAFLKNVPSSVHPQTRKKNSPLKDTTGNGIGEKDVLFGRGRVVQSHAGNARFRKYLHAHAEEYDSLPRSHRIAACIDYTQELLSSGARFMKQNETKLWVECDFNEAVEKVAQFFRTRRRDKRQGVTGS